MDSSALVLRRGQYALNAALGFGVMVILALAALSPKLLQLVPVVLMGSVAAVFVVRRPLLNLFVLLGGIALTSGYTPGITAVEVLHGSYLLAYLAGWFADRLVTRQPITQDTPERLLLLFLTAVPFTIVVTIMLDGSLSEYAQEMFAMMHLALYFPIRDACRSERGTRVVVAVFLLIALYAVVRNGLMYRENLVEATMRWQVERNRITTNDGMLMTASLFFTALVGMGAPRRIRAIGALGGSATLVGLVMTQSRAFWVCFLFGAAIFLLILDRRERRHILLLSAVGLAAALGAGLYILGPEFWLILVGLVERMATLGTALTNDISLVNRFRESRVVLEHIAQNPVVGHGSGVGYLFFEIGRSGTDTDSFVHNGYLGLWYKWGLWGLVAVMSMWVSSIVRGIRALRRRTLPPFRRLTVSAAVVSLCAYAVAANTSNPFMLNDTLFLVALLFALVHGNTTAAGEATA